MNLWARTKNVHQGEKRTVQCIGEVPWFCGVDDREERCNAFHVPETSDRREPREVGHCTVGRREVENHDVRIWKRGNNPRLVEDVGPREPQSKVGVTHDQQGRGTEHEDEDWRDVDESERDGVLKLRDDGTSRERMLEQTQGQGERQRRRQGP